MLSSRFHDVVAMARSLAKEAELGRGRHGLRGTRDVGTDAGRMEEEAARRRPGGQVRVEQGHPWSCGPGVGCFWSQFKPQGEPVGSLLDVVPFY